MKSLIIGCFLLLASFAQAKTKMLVEDPNNLVAGRYTLNSEQEVRAKEIAESTLGALKEKDLQAALAIRYVAVNAGPLTSSQQVKEPDSLHDAQKRLAAYGVALSDDRPLYPIAIFDTERHRIIHSRLYTVTELPKLYAYGRFDDYIAVYIGGNTPNHFAK
jgi:hypothetical protein